MAANDQKTNNLLNFMLFGYTVWIDKYCRTSSQWSAIAYIYEHQQIFPWSLQKIPQFIIEPDYFVLAGAIGLAASYNPFKIND